MNIKKSSLVCASVLAGVVMANAANTVQIKAGKSGLWDQESSYEGNTLPGSGDTIEIATGVQATANKADCDFMNRIGIAALKFSGTKTDTTSSLTITIGENETATNPATTSSSYSAGIIKKGEGTLVLTATGSYPFYADFMVDEGVLQFGEKGGNHHLNCAVTVKEGATLIPWTYAVSGTAAGTYFRNGLFGSGTVSNPTGKQVTLVFKHDAENAVFAGDLDGLFKITVADKTVQRFTGSAVFSEAVLSDRALLGLSSFGTIGYGVGVANTLEYLGSGETYSGTLKGEKGTKSVTVSGGDKGGLVFAGAINYSTTTNKNVDIVLSGNNSEACTFSGSLAAKADEEYASRLVKDGTGTWKRVLGAGQGLTVRDFDVRNGRLVFRLPMGGYTWYKLTIKATIVNNKTLTFARFGLFDANGEMQNKNLAKNAEAFDDWTKLEPGQVIGFNTGSIAYADLTNEAGSVENLFKPTTTGSWTPCGTDLRPSASKPLTWSGCVLRLPEGASKVVYYDIAPWYVNDTPSRAGYGPRTWELEGSYDGVKWDSLSTVALTLTEADVKAMDKVWYGSGKKFFTDEDNTTQGRWSVVSGDIDPTVGCVSVTQGATVESDRPIRTDRVEVGYTDKGLLTIDGFALNENGILDIVNVSKRRFSIPCDLTGLSLPSAYTILVNGQTPTREVVISPDKLRIGTIPTGLMLLLK